VGETTAAAADTLPDALSKRIAGEFPGELRSLLQRAVVRLLDYQDAAYASLYLDRVAQMMTLEPQGRGAAQLTLVTARSLVLWMSFEDVIRVAQVKTRAGRPEQIRREVRANAGELVRVSEFVKPRVDEICATLPAGIGRRLLTSAGGLRLLSRFTGGRQISTSSIGGFALLRGMASLRRFRRGTLRFQTENERIEQWLQLIRDLAKVDYSLAVEIAECQNLVKGYGDTHERGWRSFSEICALGTALAGSGRGARQVKLLREAALADDSGVKLAQAVAAMKLSAAA
jgi:indolepyruvate ferredoxin oxidoreductase beta subunit